MGRYSEPLMRVEGVDRRVSVMYDVDVVIYDRGTDDLAAVYADEDLSIPLANPLPREVGPHQPGLDLWGNLSFCAAEGDLYDAAVDGIVTRIPLFVPGRGDGVGGGGGTTIVGDAVDWAALRQFREALGMQHSKPCDVLLIGDSHTEGFFATNAGMAWANRLRLALQGHYNRAAVGGWGYAPAATQVSPIFAMSGGAVAVVTHGLAKRAISLPGAGATATGVAFPGDRVWVAYTEGPAYGNIRITVDGGAPVLVDTYAAVERGGRFWDSGQLSPGGSHSVTVTVDNTGANPVYNAVFEGTTWFSGDGGAVAVDSGQGVRVWASGHSGYKASDYNAGSQVWLDALDVVDPDLVIIAFGHNEYAQAQSADDYGAALETMIGNVRAKAAGDPSIVILHLFKPGAASPNQWAAYKAAIDDVCESTGAACFDVYERFPANPNAAPVASDLFYDNFHLNTYGHDLLARTLLEWLVDSEQPRSVVGRNATNDVTSATKKGWGQTVDLHWWLDAYNHLMAKVDGRGALWTEALFASITNNAYALYGGANLVPASLLIGLGTNALQVPLAIRAYPATVADFLQLQTSAGVKLVVVDINGSYLGPYMVLQPTSAANRALLLKGQVGQTGDLATFMDSAAAVLGGVSALGVIYTSPTGFFKNTVNSAAYLLYGGAAAVPANQLIALLTTQPVLVTRTAAAATANNQEWQDSAGAVLAKIAAAGILTAAALVSNGAVTAAGAVNGRTGNFTATAAGDVLLTIKQAASPTGNFVTALNSAGATIGAIDRFFSYAGFQASFGTLVAAAAPGTTILFVASASASNRVVIVRGIASQTGTLQEWQNSASSILASVTAAGLGDFNVAGIRTKHEAAATPTGGSSGEVRVGNGKLWANDAGTWKSVAIA